MIFFIIPKTTGFGLSKRRVSFHKTTRIFFEGFSRPFFLFRALSRLRVLSSLWFVLRRRFVRSESVLLFRALSRRFCSFRFCFSLALAAFSLVFPLFCDWTLLFSWFCLVILILCVLLRRGSYNHWKQPAKVQNLSRQRCRLLYFYGVCCLYNPQNDGVVFQNDGFHFTKRRVYFLRGFHTIRPWHPLKKYPLSLRMQRNLKWKSRVILVKYFCNYLLLETKSITFAL